MQLITIAVLAEIAWVALIIYLIVLVNPLWAVAMCVLALDEKIRPWGPGVWLIFVTLIGYTAASSLFDARGMIWRFNHFILDGRNRAKTTVVVLTSLYAIIVIGLVLYTIFTLITQL